MKLDDLMRDYLNQASISSLLSGHVRALSKQKYDDMTSFQVNFKYDSLAFVLPENCRKVFLEKIVEALITVSNCENHRTLRKLDEVKKVIRKSSREFELCD